MSYIYEKMVRERGREGGRREDGWMDGFAVYLIKW